MLNDLNNLNAIANLLVSLPAYIFYGIIIFPITVLLMYITLYKYLNLDLSLFSFLCFFVNIAIFFFLLSYISKPIKNSINFFVFPHLQEEIRLILYKKNQTIWGPLFSSLIENLENSKRFMVIFYAVHFLVFILFRSYMVYLLIDFTFFQGDLRELWYCIPVSFIIWLLQFFNYYFVYFLNGSYIAFHNLFVFDVKNDVMVVAFSPEATQEGFPDSALESFAHRYRSIERVYVYFQFYSFFCKIFSIALFSLQLFCWFTITTLFLLVENPFATFLGWSGDWVFRNLPPKFMLRNAETSMTHQHFKNYHINYEQTF